MVSLGLPCVLLWLAWMCPDLRRGQAKILNLSGILQPEIGRIQQCGLTAYRATNV